MNRIDLATAAQRIDAAKNVIIFCHKNPDGDTLGSAFALWAFLRSKGVCAAVRCPDEIGEIYSFLTDSYNPPEFEGEFFLAVDCSDAARLGALSAQPMDMCIDHHGSQDFFARETWLDAASASCSEMILSLLEYLNAPVTQYIANALYTGVSTDTGCFRFSNTTEKTHLAAARLIAAGAEHAELDKRFFMRKTRSRVKLEKSMYDSLDFRFGGKLAIAVIAREALEQSGVLPDDLEGLSDIPRSIQGVEVGVTIREEPEYNKVSMRSSHVNIGSVCESFGGGGHPLAAGFESTKPLGQLTEDICKVLAGVLEHA